MFLHAGIPLDLDRPAPSIDRPNTAPILKEKSTQHLISTQSSGSLLAPHFAFLPLLINACIPYNQASVAKWRASGSAASRAGGRR
jgi:hypothetical protein